MNPKITSAIITILIAGILLSIGFVIINEVLKNMPQYPDGAFVIVKKETYSDGWWIFSSTNYLFFFGNGPNDCLNVPQSDYNKYGVGDLYPNTEPRILIANDPISSIFVIPIILGGAAIIAAIEAYRIYRKDRNSPVTPEESEVKP